MARTKPPVFAIACWVLGLLAVTQLVIAALALAVRFEESRKVKIVEREVPKFITLRAPAPAAPAVERSVVSKPPVVEVEEEAPVNPTPLAEPEIADPRSERLVKEARQARVAGDMVNAIGKLEDAAVASPDDPSVMYELGLVHEAMGVFDRAAAYYEKVFQMGASGAGSLYKAAATKLRDGFEQPSDMLGKLALDRVRVFPGATGGDGERVVLTIPVEKAPDAEVDAGELEVKVDLFNRTSKNEIVLRDDSIDRSVVEQSWPSEPVDWEEGPEELRISYFIPKQDPSTSHLFGKLSYYGQVVTLSYKGEVMDVQASPRHLAARLPGRNAAGAGGQEPLPEFLDQLPPDFDPEFPLLLPK